MVYTRPARSVSGKSTKTAPESRSILERGRAEENLVDVERFVQVELDARAVLEHPEADGVLAADELLFGIDADVEMVEEQVVVGAIRPVLAAQDVGMRGGLRRGARPAKENADRPLAEGPVAHDATLSRFQPEFPPA